MTHTEKLTAVENEIRKAIPRLMELRWPIINQEFLNGFIDFIQEHKNNKLDYDSVRRELDEYREKHKTIQADIMLNDVLEFLKNKENIFTYSINTKGEIYNEAHNGYILFSKWNLSSPYLKDQSPELIDFLFNLIEK